MSEKEIMAINAAIDAAIAKGQQAQGQKAHIEAQLKNEFDIDDPSQIGQVLARLEEERKALDSKVSSGLARLKDKYGWQ